MWVWWGIVCSWTGIVWDGWMDGRSPWSTSTNFPILSVGISNWCYFVSPKCVWLPNWFDSSEVFLTAVATIFRLNLQANIFHHFCGSWEILDDRKIAEIKSQSFGRSSHSQFATQIIAASVSTTVGRKNEWQIKSNTWPPGIRLIATGLQIVLKGNWTGSFFCSYWNHKQ